MNESHRGQSEVVGSVLVISLVVLIMGLFGFAVLGSIDTEERQLTDIGVNVTATSVNVSHTGGEPIDTSLLDVVVQFDGESERYNAADAGVENTFGTGDQWQISSGLPYGPTDRGEYASVTVIAVNTGEILFTGDEEIV